jgi:apolipoprotein N-acyltransferase
VVDTDGPVLRFPEGTELQALSRRLGATLIVGTVESVGRTRFRNSAQVFSNGEVIDRYEKVHRVPFGEYVPFRSLLAQVAGNSLPDRDAIPGTRPAVLRTPVGRIGVMISWEVFFGDRARDAVNHGGQLLINPTNGSTYTGTMVQTQQIASSRLRAIETGRWEVQVAPTGFSAFVDPNGKVLQRTSVSERAVRVQRDVALRSGRTVYVRTGDNPSRLLAVFLIAGGWMVDLRARRRRADEDVDVQEVPIKPEQPALS